MLETAHYGLLKRTSGLFDSIEVLHLSDRYIAKELVEAALLSDSAGTPAGPVIESHSLSWQPLRKDLHFGPHLR